jgi:hypothetical protein
VATAIGTSQSRPLLRDAISKINYVFFFRPDLPLPEFLFMQNMSLGRWVSDYKNFAWNLKPFSSSSINKTDKKLQDCLLKIIV